MIFDFRCLECAPWLIMHRVLARAIRPPPRPRSQFMLFNSLIFIVFAIAFYAVWRFARAHAAARWGWLIAASFFFYGWYDWRYIFLLVITGSNAFYAALAIEKRPESKKALLAISIIGNLALLCAFKYLGFLTMNLNALFGSAGVHLRVIRLALPIGISFYTFQSMSYVIDVYRDKLKPTRSILHYFAFVSMFPHLIAGPIVRPADILPQLTVIRPITPEERFDGLRLIVMGYFKKVVLADNMGPFVDRAFGFGHTVGFQSMPFWWAAVAMFSFQIYYDFSGYSDIARGLARWMGYDFCLNFNHPYISGSFREFWTRWHISLSTWFRDYVYIPLGGSRRGEFRRHVNLWITMLVSGLWHGAAWTFVVWGGVHAAFLSIERITRWPERLSKFRIGKFIAPIIVVPIVFIAWVFFRANSMGQAFDIIRIMFNPAARSLEPFTLVGFRPLLYLGIAGLMEMYFYFGIDRSRFASSRMVAAIEPVILALMIAACIFFRGTGNAFIYFQF